MRKKTKWFAYTGVMTALCSVCTLFISIPSFSGGHTNLGDLIIFISAVIFDPISAFIIGGVGTMLADLISYPTTALFSLIFHGLEGLITCFLIKIVFRSINKPYFFDVISMIIGGMIMIFGFFFTKAFYYGTIESAIISLYRNILQVVISIVLTMIICYLMKLKEFATNTGLLYKYERKKRFK